MSYVNRIAAIASGFMLAACGGGGLVEDPALTRAAVAEAVNHLNSAKVAVAKAYEASRIDPVVTDLPPGHRVVPIYNFPVTANPPISTVRPSNAKYVKYITYNSAGPTMASVVLSVTGTGNPYLDGKFLGMFGVGHTDGTVTWTCGTAAAMTSLTSQGAGGAAMYPYLPDYCQN